MVNFSQLISFGGQPEAERVSPMATGIIWRGKQKSSPGISLTDYGERPVLSLRLFRLVSFLSKMGELVKGGMFDFDMLPG